MKMPAHVAPLAGIPSHFFRKPCATMSSSSKWVLCMVCTVRWYLRDGRAYLMYTAILNSGRTNVLSRLSSLVVRVSFMKAR